MNFNEIFIKLSKMQSKRVTRSNLYYCGYLDACRDAGLITEKEIKSMEYMLNIRTKLKEG